MDPPYAARELPQSPRLFPPRSSALKPGARKGLTHELPPAAIFSCVASSLSFSRAADNLHIAQSTLSQQIQRLEEHYGVQLFVRSGRTVTLTAAGLALQEAASHLLVEESQLAARLKEITKGTTASGTAPCGRSFSTCT